MKNGNGIVINSRGDQYHPGQQLNLVVNNLNNMIAQIKRERLARALDQEMFEGDRKLNEALGYPSTLTFRDLWSFYKRDRLAKRLVKLPASESWRRPPVVIDGLSKSRFSKKERDQMGDDLPEDTPFIAALKSVIKQRKLWLYLYRVDKLAGIGSYGALLIGTTISPGDRDGLAGPVAAGSLRDPEDIIYLRALKEDSAEIREAELSKDPGDPRFGLPEFYQVDLGSGVGKKKVHYSRIVHVAEEPDENELWGESRIEDAYDMLLAMKMLWGAGSEAIWRLAFQKMSVKIDPEVQFGATEQSAVETQLEALIHGLKQFIYLQGGEVETIGGEVADIEPIFDALIALISGDIPQHILLGSQAGKLASSEQDAKDWAGFIAYRQSMFVEPAILRPTIDRLIEYGALPEPDGGDYKVEWPALFELDEQAQAEVRKIEAEAQEIEWTSSGTPIVTRLKRLYGDGQLAELEADQLASEEFLPAAERNFEPGVEQ